MIRSLKPWLCAVAFVALVHAQVFGMHRGYVCELNGIVVETVADHHHAGDNLQSGHFVDYTPHSHDEDHHHETEGNNPHEEHATAGENNPQPHAPLKVELNALQLSAGLSVPMLASLAVCELPDFLFVILVPELEEMSVAQPQDDRGNLSPPACLLVSHCMVLLV